MYKLMGMTLMLCGTAFGFAQAQNLAEHLDDPTRPTSIVAPAPPVTPTPTQPTPPRFTPEDYRLSATYVLGSIQRARINGDWFDIGARLRDGVITDIKADQITVATAERHYVLTPPTARATFSIIEEAP